MSFMSALASCWDVCKQSLLFNFFPFSEFAHENNNAPVLSGFYETYQLSDHQYTLRDLPPGIYRNKHLIEVVYEDEQGNRSYQVRVGLTSIEDKLVNSFLGLPFAIVESLYFLAWSVIVLLIGGAVVAKNILKFVFYLALSPILIFFIPRQLAVQFLELLITIAIVATLAIYFSFLVIYPLLKALIKIPAGIGIGIDAFTDWVLDKQIDPPTISDIDELTPERVRQTGIRVKSVDNEFEVGLKGIGFSQSLPERYLCPIGAGVIEPVLLNDGYIYARSTAESFFDEQNPVGPYDRTPLQENLLPLGAYHAETEALVNALVAEHSKAGAENRAPNYDLILQCAEKHSAIAKKLHDQLTAFFEGGKSVDSSAITLIAVTLQDQQYQFKVSASTVRAAFQLIQPIIGEVEELNQRISDSKAAQIFIGKLRKLETEHPNYRRLFVTALTESVLAEQNFAQKFQQTAVNTASSEPSVVEEAVSTVRQTAQKFWSNPLASSTSAPVHQNRSGLEFNKN